MKYTVIVQLCTFRALFVDACGEFTLHGLTIIDLKIQVIKSSK